MQYALIGNVVVEIFGGLLFFLAAIFLIRDRLRVHRYLASKLVFLLSSFILLFTNCVRNIYLKNV
jgi:hypothetical protein